MNTPAAKLILASASPRRRELLAGMGVSFDVVVAQVTEHEAHDADPRDMVRHNAAIKAEWVAERHPGRLVLGADTTVFIDNTVLNKPRDLDDARLMLRKLSGRTHTVFTGLAVRLGGGDVCIDEGVSSEVTFKTLTDAMIETYIGKAHVLDKAGAYGIQEHGDIIVDHWTGSFTNIVGLPVEKTKQILTRLGLC